MAHRRSPLGFVRRLVLVDAFYDGEQAEIACRTNSLMYVAQLKSEFGDDVNISDLNIERGEVLVDSRGRGTFQQ